MKKLFQILVAIIRWTLVLFVLLMSVGSFGQGYTVAGIAFMILAVFLLPLKGLDGFWRKISSGKKWLRPVLCIALVIAGLGGMATEAGNGNIRTETAAQTTKPIKKSSPTPSATPTPTPTPTATPTPTPTATPGVVQTSVTLSSIPAYSGQPYVPVNNNVPYFTDADMTTSSFEYYSNLDSLGRCGQAVASIGKDLMPTTPRGSIGMVRPTGWHTIRYDGIEGKYLYNRCHLIGYQLTAENANEKNLITGTRYMNTQGMEPFENQTADYIKETNNHVMYRVTPIFDGNNLVASGVLMEGKSVEDQGKGVLFCVYCYNVQPGITIDYATGNSSQTATPAPTPTPKPKVAAAPAQPAAPAKQAQQQPAQSGETYIGNVNTMKFHHSWCSSVKQMNNSNKVTFSSRDEAINAGYQPCKRCNP